MIVDFKIANYGPFRDPAVLSMVPSAKTDSADAIAPSKAVKAGLLKTAVIFGANASGKSYIFEALNNLKELVSEIRYEGAGVPGCHPYRLSRECLESPVEMEIRLDIDGILYDYSVSLLDDRIVSESLFYSPKGRSVPVFMRGKEEERMDPKIADRLTDSSTYLLLASGFNNRICNTVLNEILSMNLIYQPTDGSVSDSYMAAEEDPEIRSMMESALEAADLGITGFRGKEKKSSRTGKREYGAEGLVFIHSFEGTDSDEVMRSFPYYIESSGTIELFTIMGPISKALKNGSVVVIDEFGSNLHPMLTRWVINLFNGKENESGAQLIVNTHDIGLMDIDGFLRRDEIWFVDKNRRDGSSKLFSLSDFNGVRKGSNVRKDYLMGRFDGIPAIIGVRKL